MEDLDLELKAIKIEEDKLKIIKVNNDLGLKKLNIAHKIFAISMITLSSFITAKLISFIIIMLTEGLYGLSFIFLLMIITAFMFSYTDNTYNTLKLLEKQLSIFYRLVIYVSLISLFLLVEAVKGYLTVNISYYLLGFIIVSIYLSYRYYEIVIVNYLNLKNTDENIIEELDKKFNNSDEKFVKTADKYLTHRQFLQYKNSIKKAKNNIRNKERILLKESLQEKEKELRIKIEKELRIKIEKEKENNI